MDSDGHLYKPNGTGGNLRWDTGLSQLPYSFKRQNHKGDDLSSLQDLVIGIAGGSNELRSQWVFDNLDLPEVRPAGSKMIKQAWETAAALESYDSMQGLPCLRAGMCSD